MASLMEELIDTLNAEETLYGKLIPIEEEKTQAIIGNDLEALQDITVREHELVDKTSALENQVLKDLIETRKAKGMVGAPLRVMVVGIPNVGKSSFINRMSGSKKAKVEDRPGVTRTKQWVKLGDRIEMLDMPGVLWPKFDDQLVARKLAFTGAIRDDILDIETLAMLLLEYLAENYPACLKERYKMDSEGLDGKELLELLGRKRGMLISGGEVNTERAAIMLLDEFRAGKTGCISLEKPEE